MSCTTGKKPLQNIAPRCRRGTVKPPQHGDTTGLGVSAGAREPVESSTCRQADLSGHSARRPAPEHPAGQAPRRPARFGRRSIWGSPGWPATRAAIGAPDQPVDVGSCPLGRGIRAGATARPGPRRSLAARQAQSRSPPTARRTLRGRSSVRQRLRAARIPGSTPPRRRGWQGKPGAPLQGRGAPVGV